MQTVFMARLVFGIKRLKLSLHLIHSYFIQQLAQVEVAQNLFQLRLIYGESLRAALGQRRIAFIDVVSNIGKQ